MLVTEKELQASWKKIAKRRVTVNGVVSPDHAFLFAVHVIASGNQNATVKVYDGHGIGDPFYLTLKTNGTITRPFNFDPPMYFRKGIYVTKCTDTEAVILHFLPVKE